MSSQPPASTQAAHSPASAAPASTTPVRRRVLVLATAQALYWSCAIIGIALTGLVGQQLAPWPLLATLPLSLLVAGNLLAIAPLARAMQRWGRARGLQLGALAGVAAGLLAAWAVLHASFIWFCVAMLLLGAYQASAGFYRFAALDGLAPERKGRAASAVLAGGIAAAVLAPSLALWANQALPQARLGAYLSIAALAVLGVVLLQLLPAQLGQAPAPLSRDQRRNLRAEVWQLPGVRLALAITACGHGLMILVMNATPLAMQAAGHSLAHGTQVIQWHVLGMFLPSLIAGRLVDRLGARRVAAVGLGLLLLSSGAALTGTGFAPFLISSLLLGAGWNLMLLAGTTLLAQSSSAAQQAVAQPGMEMLNGASAAFMSLACGVLVQTLGWAAINVLMLLPLLALAWLLLRNVRQGAAQA